MSRPCRCAFGFLITMCVLATSLNPSAQEPDAQLSGLVADPMGWGVRDVSVEITSVGANVRRRVKTDGTGRYAVDKLTRGTYKLDVRANAFETLLDEISVAGADVQRDVRLTLSPAAQTLTVTANGGIGSLIPRRSVRNRGSSPPNCSPESMVRKEGGRVVFPSKIVNVEPVFTTDAWAVGSNGIGRVAGVIGRTGTMQDLKILNATHPAFAKEVMDVVAQWQFTPKYLNCSPVETPFEVTVNFQRER